MVSTSHSSSIDKFVMQRPKIQMKNVSWNIENELEQLRKILIESFFQPATTCTDIIIKRKVLFFPFRLINQYHKRNLAWNTNK